MMKHLLFCVVIAVGLCGLSAQAASPKKKAKKKAVPAAVVTEKESANPMQDAGKIYMELNKNLSGVQNAETAAAAVPVIRELKGKLDALQEKMDAASVAQLQAFRNIMQSNVQRLGTAGYYGCTELQELISSCF